MPVAEGVEGALVVLEWRRRRGSEVSGGSVGGRRVLEGRPQNLANLWASPRGLHKDDPTCAGSRLLLILPPSPPLLEVGAGVLHAPRPSTWPEEEKGQEEK